MAKKPKKPKKPKNLDDLFHDGLKDLYFAKGSPELMPRRAAPTHRKTGI
jgi:hypothetical protein